MLQPPSSGHQRTATRRAQIPSPMNNLSASSKSSALPLRLLRFAMRLFAFTALIQINWAADVGTGTIAGTVTSTSTRNALQGATVTVPALNRAEFTDSSGAFLLPDLPAGPVEVLISYTGFADERRTVTVRPGEPT